MTRRESDYFPLTQKFPIDKTHDPRTTKIDRTQLLSEHATLSFLVTSIYHKLYNRFLRLMHSLGDGYYFVDNAGQSIKEEEITQLDAELRKLLNSNEEIKIVYSRKSDLIASFTKVGHADKVALLKTWVVEMIPCIVCGDYIDYVLEPMSTDKQRLLIFDMRAYADGLIVRFPTMLNPTSLKDYTDPSALFDMFHEFKEWAKLIDCDTVGKLNEIIFKRKIDDLKWIAEGLHEQKFAKIAKSLVKNKNKRVITIAGPSSSNKTTFALRLAIGLRVNGCKSTVISMDDFYKNRSDIPFGADGLQDFESINALNIEVLADKVKRLLAGEKVPERKFDFASGIGYDSDKLMELHENEFLIIEGIHGLNPQLLVSLGRENVTPIYVSALTPLNLDYNHRFPTSDLRLIRRIIRDYRYRGYSPRETIRRWTSVRVGEERNIFPFQGNAEFFFNSALVYELPVLSVSGKALLAEATVPAPTEDLDSPVTQEITREANRLLGLLNFFYPASTEIVPHISCIREFVGGSDLKY